MGNLQHTVNLDVIPSAIPFEICCEESDAFVNSAPSTELRSVGVENRLVGSRLVDADAVVSVAVAGMEIEDEKQAGSLENDNLVGLVLQADVCLRSCQPSILLFHVLHGTVKVIEPLVPEQLVVNEVELSASVVERVVVSSAREIEPFRMTELVA